MVDYFDCIILSTTIGNCDALMTEDNLIHDLKDNGTYQAVVKKKNPGFELLSRRDLARL